MFFLLCTALWVLLGLQLPNALAQNSSILPNSTALHNFPTSSPPTFYDRDSGLKIGDEVTVALITIGGYTGTTDTSENSTGAQGWTYVYQSALNNAVDDYALLDVKYSALQDWYQEADTHVRVEIGSIVSPWRRRQEGTSVVPFWTVIAELEDGNLVSLEWDDFTDNCETQIEGNCAVELSQCSEDKDCDLKTYIAWTGIDVDGTYLTSKGQTISNFRQWSVSKYYDAASEGIGDIPDKIPTGDEIKDDLFGG